MKTVEYKVLDNELTHLEVFVGNYKTPVWIEQRLTGWRININLTEGWFGLFNFDSSELPIVCEITSFAPVYSLVQKLHEYIYYYNNKRISFKLKMSPVKYRTQF